MPMPVYFEIAGRMLSVTDDEARELATRLPQESQLHNAIMMRVGVNVSSPVHLDVGGDEHANLVALNEAIESFEQENELSPAIKTLRKCCVVAIGTPDGE
jgi:hypothetical protein